MQVTSDADEEHVLPLYMPSKKDTGELSGMGVPFFLHVIAQVPDTFLRPFGSKRQSRAKMSFIKYIADVCG